MADTERKRRPRMVVERHKYQGFDIPLADAEVDDFVGTCWCPHPRGRGEGEQFHCCDFGLECCCKNEARRELMRRRRVGFYGDLRTPVDLS